MVPGEQCNWRQATQEHVFEQRQLFSNVLSGHRLQEKVYACVCVGGGVCVYTQTHAKTHAYTHLIHTGNHSERIVLSLNRGSSSLDTLAEGVVAIEAAAAAADDDDDDDDADDDDDDARDATASAATSCERRSRACLTTSWPSVKMGFQRVYRV